ncbi:MAG: hypothetical protein CH6_1089 [Candidatus Kapaibacterium sp.]|nr:MAG: hypothetical protein CH6_1089 [Candidatus Kapabacteria bacterium]
MVAIHQIVEKKFQFLIGRLQSIQEFLLQKLQEINFNSL